jgi:hypothetical protein
MSSVLLPIPKKYIGKEIQITYSLSPVVAKPQKTERKKENISTLLAKADKQYKEGKYTTIKTKKELNTFFDSL